MAAVARERRRERRSQVRTVSAASCRSPSLAFGVSYFVRLRHMAAVAQEEAKRAARDAAREAAALAASMGPTAAELKVRARAWRVAIVWLSFSPGRLKYGRYAPDRCNPRLFGLLCVCGIKHPMSLKPDAQAMPLPSAAASPGPPGDAADGSAAGAAPDGEAPADAAAKQPTSGLSFANITKLGYAATGAPTQRCLARDAPLVPGWWCTVAETSVHCGRQ